MFLVLCLKFISLRGDRKIYSIAHAFLLSAGMPIVSTFLLFTILECLQIESPPPAQHPGRIVVNMRLCAQILTSLEFDGNITTASV